TDLDLSLRTSCTARVKKEGSCTIPARKLYDYVRLLPDGDISIKMLENHWVQIRSGRSNTKMVGMARANFPAVPNFPAAGAVKLPAHVLRTMINKTIFAISSEESRYTLNGALMVLKPESITMVATDGHRLARDNTKAVVVTCEEISSAIQRVAQFADERSGAIRLKLEKDEIRVSSSSTETGESEDSIETTYKADPLVIGFNSQYLLDFFKASNSNSIRLEFKDPQSAGQLRPEEDNTAGEQYKYRYVVMPMRI